VRRQTVCGLRPLLHDFILGSIGRSYSGTPVVGFSADHSGLACCRRWLWRTSLFPLVPLALGHQVICHFV
jgi:hypothetical protein